MMHLVEIYAKLYVAPQPHPTAPTPRCQEGVQARVVSSSVICVTRG